MDEWTCADEAFLPTRRKETLRLDDLVGPGGKDRGGLLARNLVKEAERVVRDLHRMERLFGDGEGGMKLEKGLEVAAEIAGFEVNMTSRQVSLTH